MHDLQASPKCIELFGWDKLQEIANGLSDDPDLTFYPEALFYKSQDVKVKVIMIEYEGVTVTILPYIDNQGIKVMSFDPSRTIPADAHFVVKDGQHRVIK